MREESASQVTHFYLKRHELDHGEGALAALPLAPRQVAATKAALLEERKENASAREDVKRALRCTPGGPTSKRQSESVNRSPQARY